MWEVPMFLRVLELSKFVRKAISYISAPGTSSHVIKTLLRSNQSIFMFVGGAGGSSLPPQLSITIVNINNIPNIAGNKNFFLIKTPYIYRI
jgi:hypothetical protein